ncbi:MAG: ABC transporter substrate-binding protein [Streptomyces sp.]|uniref:ABC transporter substrate-binding protein n=1 Tax=Streptomyces sp. TaxID=1931 RepID=UPI003D6C3369
MKDARNTPSHHLADRLGRRDFLRLGGYGITGAMLAGTSGCGVLSGGESSGGGGKAGSLTAAYGRSLDNLDPHGAFAAAEPTRLASEQIFDSLLGRVDGKIVPRLAAKWDNPHPKTWVFTLRDDVTFHDGSPLTARDVAASIERQAKTDSPLADLWELLDRAQAEDDRTVVVQSKEPLGTVLANMTLMRVLPADKMDKPDFFQKPIGSGPYKVTQFAPGSQLSLEANTHYWDGKPDTPRVVLRIVTEEASRITGLETGETQLTWPIPGDQLKRLEDSEDVTILDTASYQYWFNWFNCSRKPFTDPDVRRALWHAIDAKALAKNIFPGSAQVARAPISSSVFGYAAQEPYAYDPKKAKSLLAKAGFPNGFSTSVMWNQSQAPQIRQVAETMISYWREIGVKVQPQELEEAQWTERLLALDWDMDLQTNVTATGDADYSLGRLYLSSANRLGYKNPKLDKVLNAARQSQDQNKRKQLYSEACRIIWQEAPGIFPIEMRLNFATRKNVRGFEATPDESPSLRQVRLT